MHRSNKDVFRPFLRFAGSQRGRFLPTHHDESAGTVPFDSFDSRVTRRQLQTQVKPGIPGLLLVSFRHYFIWFSAIAIIFLTIWPPMGPPSLPFCFDERSPL